MHPPSKARDIRPDEQRNSSRFQREVGTDYAALTQQHTAPQLVPVVNESLGGIGILTDHRKLFFIGQELELAYADSVFPGVVRHITRRHEERFVVGIEQVSR